MSIRLLSLSAVFLFVATATCPGDPPSDAVALELARHQGTWRATVFVWDGTATRPEIVATIVRVVENDHVVWKRDGKSFAGTRIVLDPSRTPGTIDVIADGGPSRDQRVPGIYRLQGDTLTLCMAAPGARRPTEFRAEKGSGRTLMTFRRERTDPAAPQPTGR